MKIAICDDDMEVLTQLSGFIRQYAANNTLDYTILQFEESGKLLTAIRKDSEIQILFLDIYMSPISGIDLAEKLRKEGNHCAIIFVTMSTDHYARSYEVDAEHYLVKPVAYDRVEAALSRCERKLRAAVTYTVFAVGNREIKVPLRQIRYAEVFRNQTIIHAAEDIFLRSTLEAVRLQLSDPCFIRIHRSFLINMEFISARYGSNVCLKTGEQIPLSRACEKKFEYEYGRFLTNSIMGNE